MKSPTLASISVKKTLQSLDKGKMHVFIKINEIFAARADDCKPVSPTLQSLRSGSIKDVLLMIQDEVKGRFDDIKSSETNF